MGTKTVEIESGLFKTISKIAKNRGTTENEVVNK